jgi:hypothetical protein
MMKPLYFLLLLLTLVSCSKTPEQRACEAVSEFVKQNLHNPKSYEAGEFDIKPIIGESAAYNKGVDSLSRLMKANKISLSEWITQDSILLDKYRDELTVGWDIQHAYRATNAFGALVAEQGSFKVDKQYKVTDYKGSEL